MSDQSTAAPTAPRPAGTLRVFKWLHPGKQATIRHGMHTLPLVDVYELADFEAVVWEDEMSLITRVQFYVYHDSDAIARGTDAAGNLRPVTVQDHDDPWHIPFTDALKMVGVQYDGDRHLGDVVGAFWDALFAPPSDRFDEPVFGVSPWVERDVGARRTMRSIQPDEGGEWNNLNFRFRARKIINGAVSSGGDGGGRELMTLMEAVKTWLRDKNPVSAQGMALKLYDEMRTRQVAVESGAVSDAARIRAAGGPAAVEVIQLDLETVGLRLLGEGGEKRELGVMVLLRS
jgi:hypothetical protein